MGEGMKEGQAAGIMRSKFVIPGGVLILLFLITYVTFNDIMASMFCEEQDFATLAMMGFNFCWLLAAAFYLLPVHIRWKGSLHQLGQKVKFLISIAIVIVWLFLVRFSYEGAQKRNQKCAEDAAKLKAMETQLQPEVSAGKHDDGGL